MKVGTLLVRLGTGNTQSTVLIKHGEETLPVDAVWIRKKDGTVIIRTREANE